MGSRNPSGSVQSSSSGDEFEIPSFLSSDPSSAHFGRVSAVSNHYHHLPSAAAALFDSSTSYLPQPFSNMDLLQSSSAGAPPSILAHHHQQGGSYVGYENGAISKFPTYPSSDSMGCPNRTTTSLCVRNPKKRTRASRRAPTTVLATDTSNFRAMVQEFTGVPAPPFSGYPYSRRLDLSGFRSGHFDLMGSLYPTRPSTEKIQSLSGSALPEQSNLISSGPASGYLSMQNPSSSFQSLLQRPPRHQASGSSQDLHHHADEGGYGDEGKVLDYTGAPSGFDHQNGTFHVPGGRDGTFDSWISHS